MTKLPATSSNRQSITRKSGTGTGGNGSNRPLPGVMESATNVVVSSGSVSSPVVAVFGGLGKKVSSVNRRGTGTPPTVTGSLAVNVQALNPCGYWSSATAIRDCCELVPGSRIVLRLQPVMLCGQVDP